MTSVRWMHYCMEGESPGLQSPLLHILSRIIKSSQGGPRYGSQHVSDTHTNWKHMASCKHRAGNVFVLCLIHPFMFHTILGAAEVVFLLLCDIRKIHDSFINITWPNVKYRNVWSYCYRPVFHTVYTGIAVHVPSLTLSAWERHAD